MRVLLAILLATAAVAGCASSSDETVSDPIAPPAARLTWVHTSNGTLVDEAQFGSPLPAFAQINVTTRISGEPTIAVTRTGAVFYPSIDFDVGAPGATRLPSTVLFRSLDAGATWEDASPNLAGVGTHPTSFDPYVYADPGTGRVFALDMGPHVACNKVSWSTDDGRTWMTRDGACPLPVADHPTLFAGPRSQVPALPGVPFASYPNVVYLCSNQVADVQCSTSLDGGLTWGPSQPVFTGVLPEPLAENPNDFEAWLCGSLTGHGHASWADGTAYLGKMHCGTPMAGVSRDGGLTWQAVAIASDSLYASFFEHDVSIGTDRAGTAYAAWLGNGDTTVYLSHSTDRGATWSAPLNVTAPGLTAVKLPSLVAGEAGRVALQYVGTATPSGHRVDATNDAGELEHEAEYLNATWNVYVGMTLNATAPDPVFATTTINRLDQPLKRGGCYDRCMGTTGGMYDFFDIDIDPVTGRLWSAIVDVCTVECDLPGATAADRQDSFGAVGKQLAGPFLLDEPIPAAA